MTRIFKRTKTRGRTQEILHFLQHVIRWNPILE